jgi:uncharacterized protein (DUF4415 family)
MQEDDQLAPDPTVEDGQGTADSATPPREAVELDLEEYVLEWFQAQGEHYEDLMNQVLCDYIAAEEAASKGEAGQDGT